MMENRVASTNARRFLSPETSVGPLDAELASQLLSAAAEVALVIDKDGIIQDLALGSNDLSEHGFSSFIGRPWIDTVTVESRPKIEELLADAAAKRPPRWRQVNHPSPSGEDIPINYSAVSVSTDGRVIAIGRDLRSIAALQRRLVDTQLSMEREYSRLRQSETRYRLLFQVVSEGVLVVDAVSKKVVEANPSAIQIVAQDAKKVVGRSVLDLFDEGSATEVGALLEIVLAAGRSDDIAVHLAASGEKVTVSDSLFRQGRGAYHLLRIMPAEGAGAGPRALPKATSALLKIVEHGPEGFVVTSPGGEILYVNRAFLEMAQLASEERAVGQSIGSWLGRPGVDLNVLLSNLRDHGSIRMFGTTLRGEFGSSVEVEISAVSAPGGDLPCLGFVIRNVGGRLYDRPTAGEKQVPRSVEQLTELVGRVPLKELVRETTDMIERLCIEAALELTGDNRASAAEMLGLSRQSLYAKLHRYGLGDLPSENGE